MITASYIFTEFRTRKMRIGLWYENIKALLVYVQVVEKLL